MGNIRNWSMGLLIAVVMLCGIWAGCASTDVKNEIVADVNGEAIRVLELREFLGIRGGYTSAVEVPPEKKKEALDRLVGGRLLAQEARAKGLDNTDEFRAQMRQNEQDILITALLQKEVESKVKVSGNDVKEEAKKRMEADKKLEEKEAEARAGKTVYEKGVRKVQEDLIAEAKKEAPPSVDKEMLEKIVKGEKVGDEVAVAMAGAEKVTYGEVKRILQAIVASAHGKEDLSRNKVAIERILDRELTKRALLGQARKQGVEGSKWMAEVRKETERILLINLLAESEILKGVVVTDKDIETTYKEHAEKFVRDGKKIPLEKIKGEIREFVTTNMKRKAIELYIEGLKRKARITVNEAVLSKV